jgi:alpha-D-ribose 1-methylphosphonate 5-triphosphate diphosphatase
MAATLRAISATCRAHGVTLASHDDDTAEKVALMQTLSTGISEVPVTFEVATGLPLSSGPVSV